MKKHQKTSHYRKPSKTNEISTFWPPRTDPRIAPDLQNHPKGPPGRSQDAPRASKDAQGPPKRHPKDPKGAPRDPKHPKSMSQHVADPPNLSNAHQKHAQSTSLIPQISPKKPMWLRTIYRFLTFIISAIWALVAYGSAGDAKRIQYIYIYIHIYIYIYMYIDLYNTSMWFKKCCGQHAFWVRCQNI